MATPTEDPVAKAASLIVAAFQELQKTGPEHANRKGIEDATPLLIEAYGALKPSDPPLAVEASEDSWIKYIRRR